MTALLALALLAQTSQASTDKAVLLGLGNAFFEKGTYWVEEAFPASGDVVVFNPQYRSQKRSNWAEVKGMVTDKLTGDLAYVSGEKWDGATAEKQEEIKLFKPYATHSLKLLRGLEKGSMQARAVEPLKEGWLGSRVAVQSLQRNDRMFQAPRRDGKEVSFKAYLTTDPPGYSRSGKYAVVAGSFPWSIHHGDIWAVLEKKNGGWRVVSAVTAIYP